MRNKILKYKEFGRWKTDKGLMGQSGGFHELNG